MVEVRWHGRGGQGAVTAAKILAESALSLGRFIQAFPEYGAERMGAPIKAYTRVSKTKIDLHCNVTSPSIVAVLDPTLLAVVDVCEGVPDDGIVLVNSHKTPAKIKSQLSNQKVRLYTVDANTISMETIGRAIPNTPMIGALIKATQMMDIDQVSESFGKKFADKFSPKVVQGNIDAIKRAYQEVKDES